MQYTAYTSQQATCNVHHGVRHATAMTRSGQYQSDIRKFCVCTCRILCVACCILHIEYVCSIVAYSIAVFCLLRVVGRELTATAHAGGPHIEVRRRRCIGELDKNVVYAMCTEERRCTCARDMKHATRNITTCNNMHTQHAPTKKPQNMKRVAWSM